MPSKAQENTNDSSKLAEDRAKLISDLKVLIDDAKVLTSDASASSQEFVQERAEAVKAQLNEGIDKLKVHYGAAKDKTVEATDDLEKLIKKHPWRAVGVGLLVGIVIDRILRD